MKILLINSDLAKNRGDRAITEGMVALIKTRYPDAVITGLSEEAARDSKWFGINFLNMDAQSLSPIALFKLLQEAKRSDIVLWGGGELLKDYTNFLGLCYWTLKAWLVSLVNRNLYGAYQGIGPTKRWISKKLIVFAVNRTKLFITRESESAAKLKTWGAKSSVIAASDPAIFVKVADLAKNDMDILKNYDIDDKFLNNFVGIGPRRWFHYGKSGLIPFKYKSRITNLLNIKPKSNNEFEAYKKSLVKVVDLAISSKHHVLLVPMHMGDSEGDTSFCEELKAGCSNPKMVKVLGDDTISPALLRKIIRRAKYFVGFRLHSTILSTSASIPSINYYYVDKGRQFFEQIGMQRFSAPVETLLQGNFETIHRQKVAEIESSEGNNKKLRESIMTLRKIVIESFGEVNEEV